MKKYICFQIIVCMIIVAVSIIIASTGKFDEIKSVMEHVVTDSSQIHTAEENIAKFASMIVVGD